MSAFASPAKFGSANAFIASIPDSQLDQSSIAIGDLTGDGLDDLAIVVASEKDIFDRSQQLFVLTQDSSGQFLVTTSSQNARVAGMGCCWVESLEITDGSIFIQNNAKTACDIEAATHQFKLYRGQWRLIGLKIFFYQHCDDPQVSDTLDINILTGKTIHEHQLDERPPRIWTTRTPPMIYLLKDYDFFNGFGAPET
jgi:hypothetical protein